MCMNNTIYILAFFIKDFPYIKVYIYLKVKLNKIINYIIIFIYKNEIKNKY